MPETVESFVRKLQQDGVQAGIEAGEQERQKIASDAAHILSDARAKADAIINDGREINRQERLKHEHELMLAARDVVLRLQQQLGQAAEAIVKEQAARVLDDPNTLKTLIEKVALPFVEAHASGPNEVIKFQVAREDVLPVIRDALGRIGKKQREAEGPDFQITSGLDAFGFEYKHDGTTVAITAQSVADLLGNYLSEEVAKTVQAAIREPSP